MVCVCLNAFLCWQSDGDQQGGAWHHCVTLFPSVSKRLGNVACSQTALPHHPAPPARRRVFIQSCICAGPTTGRELWSEVLQESVQGGSREHGTHPAVGKLVFDQKRAGGLLVCSPAALGEGAFPCAFAFETQMGMGLSLARS